MRSMKIRCLSAMVGVAALVYLGLAIAGSNPTRLFTASSNKQNPPKREEEEEDVRPKKKIVVEDAEEKGPAAMPPGAGTDLKQAASETRHRKLRSFYTTLSVPHDKFLIFRRPRSEWERVAPVSMRIKDIKLDIPEKATYRILDDKTHEPGEEKPLDPRDIRGVQYYEELAVEQVLELFQMKLHDRPATDELFLPRYAQLQAAETALTSVMRFHESARSRGVRAGTDADWSDLADKVRETLLRDVLLAQLQLLSETKAWDAGFNLARRLVETYTRGKDHELMAGPVGRFLEMSMKDTVLSTSKLAELRQRIEFLKSRFPNSAVINPLTKRFAEQAAGKLNQAKNLVPFPNKKDIDPRKREEAKKAARAAADIWPDLPGLRQYLLEIDDEYRTLGVAVRTLPKYLSPGWATTDAELRAVELQFEGLMELTADDHGALYYRSMLALGRPLVLARGREVHLARNAHWSDGSRLTADDVRYTVNLLRQIDDEKERPWRCRVTGRCTSFGEMLKPVVIGNDPFQCRLYFNQGLMDPPGALSFPVLPTANGIRPNADTEAFAERPVGSGPFALGPRESLNGRETVLFKANAYYARTGKENLPRTKGVRFLASTDPIKELQAGPTERDSRIHIALDLTEEQFVAARQAGALHAPWPSRLIPDRRIWLLALSSNTPVLRNGDLRLALAHAINRKALIDNHFRKGLAEKDKDKVHRELVSPYPIGAWPHPAVPDGSTLFDERLAQTKANAALRQLNRKEIALTVKYAAGDDRVREALDALCAQVNKTLSNVQLNAVPRTPYELRKEVERTGDFDIAYYAHDFVDESYWLAPLLRLSNPVSGGLGGKDLLAEQSEKAVSLRNMEEARKATLRIHQQFIEAEMPFIPLWQLDMLYAARKTGLILPRIIDQRRIFSGIEDWRVTQDD